ncbi:MAG: hypothetical protein SNI51_00225 [Rikenellaceae bacterium]
MKKLLTFLTSLFVALFFAASCDKSDLDPITPDLETEVITPFELTISGQSVEDVTAMIQYDDLLDKLPYIVGVVEKSYYDETLNGGEEQLVSYILDEVEAKGANATTVDGEYIYSGDASVLLSSYWEVEASKEYYVALFAVDQEGVLLTDVVVELTEELTAAEEPNDSAPTATFVESTHNTITIDVALNGYEGNYFVYICTTENYENNYGGDALVATQALIEEQIELGVDFSVVDNVYIFDSEREINVANGWLCYGDTDFSIFTFGVDSEGGITTDIDVVEARTADFPLEDVEVVVESVSINDIVVTAMAPSTEDILVLYLIGKSEYESLDMSPKSLVYPVLSMYEANYIDIFECTSPYSFMGEAVSVSLNDGFVINMDTSYIILSFVVNQEYALLSDVTVTETRTSEYVEPDADLESLTISDVTYFNARATVDAGSYTGNYYLTIYPAMEIEREFDGSIEDMVDWMIEYELDYGTDFSNPNDRWVFSGDLDGFLLGDGGWSILPGTDYYVFAFGVSPYGEVVTEIMQSELFSTPSLGDLAFDISVSDITESSATTTVKPTIDDIPYFTWIFKSSAIEGMSDSEILYKISVEISTEFLFGTRTGDYTYTTEELSSDTEYSVIAFGYQPSAGMLTTVDKYNFTTLSGGEDASGVPDEIIIPDVEFGELTLDECTDYSIYVNVTPLDSTMDWLIGFMSADVYDALGTPEAVIKSHLQSIYDSTTKDFFYQLWWDCYTGSRNPGLYSSADGDYVVFVYGIDVNTAQPLSKLVDLRVTKGSSAVAPAAVNSLSPYISRESYVAPLKGNTQSQAEPKSNTMLKGFSLEKSSFGFMRAR